MVMTTIKGLGVMVALVAAVIVPALALNFIADNFQQALIMSLVLWAVLGIAWVIGKLT